MNKHKDAFRINPLDSHCPFCKDTNRQTLGRVDQTATESNIGLRAGGVSVVRRRSCMVCEGSWLTYEVNEAGMQLLKEAWERVNSK